MYALSWKLAHPRTAVIIFCNFSQKIITEENSCIMFHISFTDCNFFLWEGQGYCLEIRTKFHLGNTKKRGIWGEAQNEVGFLAKITFIKQDANFISQTVNLTNF